MQKEWKKRFTGEGQSRQKEKASKKAKPLRDAPEKYLGLVHAAKCLLSEMLLTRNETDEGSQREEKRGTFSRGGD